MLGSKSGGDSSCAVLGVFSLVFSENVCVFLWVWLGSVGHDLYVYLLVCGYFYVFVFDGHVWM